MEIAHLLAGGAHCASGSLVRQSLESRFQPVKRQLKTPIIVTGITCITGTDLFIHSFIYFWHQPLGVCSNKTYKATSYSGLTSRILTCTVLKGHCFVLVSATCASLSCILSFRVHVKLFYRSYRIVSYKCIFCSSVLRV